MSSFRSQRGPGVATSPPYASIAGWNQLDSETRFRIAEQAGRRPRPPRPPARAPRRKRWQRIRHLLFWLFIILVAIPGTLIGLTYAASEIPAPGTVPMNQTATVTAADGTTPLAKVIPPEGNRVPVPLSDVPRHVRDAVISAEDRNFYANPGFSPSGMGRAVRDNALGRDDAGGGSTITQQYVKNVFLDSDRTVSRKLHELILSAKLAREWSKDDILGSYLNTIYFGRGAYGIAAASGAYFGKPVTELTVAEGAVLAAIIRSPSGLDPQTQLPQLLQRWEWVLDGMVDLRALSPADRAATVFPAILPPPADADPNATRGPEGHIKRQVLRELFAAGITEQELNTGALNIVTTIDPRAQQAAQNASWDTLGGQPPELRNAVVSIDPRSGAVRAYYGGGDGLGFDFAQAPLQTGSAFKTFAVIAALEQGIPLSRAFDSAPVEVTGTTVRNVRDESCGTCSVAEAFKRSLNTSFLRLTLSMFDGPQSIANAAHNAGIPLEIPGVNGQTLAEADGPPVPSIVLGAYQVRPIDMASAYATLAAGGMYHQPYFVQRVVRADGRVLLDRGAPEHQVGAQLPPGEQRIAPTIARQTVEAMLPIPAYSNGHALNGRPAAAKTGTTQLGETGENKDAWMVGFTPSLSTAVWVGTEQNLPIRTAWGGPVYGSGLPSDIWKRTMDDTLADTPPEGFGDAPAGPGPIISPAPGPIIPAAPAPAPQPSGGPYDILNPPAEPEPSTQPQAPFIIFPPASTQYTPPPEPAPAPQPPVVVPPPPPAPRQIEILPGVTVPVP